LPLQLHLHIDQRDSKMKIQNNAHLHSPRIRCSILLHGRCSCTSQLPGDSNMYFGSFWMRSIRDTGSRPFLCLLERASFRFWSTTIHRLTSCLKLEKSRANFGCMVQILWPSRFSIWLPCRFKIVFGVWSKSCSCSSCRRRIMNNMKLTILTRKMNNKKLRQMTT
jgi:hypothetical protein